MKKFILVLISVLFFTSLYSQDSKILKGHTDDINALAFSNDGKYLYSGGDDESLITWDLSNMKLLKSNNIGKKIFKIIPLPKNDELYLVYKGFYGGIFNFSNAKIEYRMNYGVEYMPISNKIFTVYQKCTISHTKGYKSQNVSSSYFLSTYDINVSELINPIKIFNYSYSFDRGVVNSSSENNTDIISIPATISSNEKYYAFTNYMENSTKDSEGKVVGRYTELNIYSVKDNSLKIKNGGLYINNDHILKFDMNGDCLFIVDSYYNDMIMKYNVTKDKWENALKGHDKRILCLEMHPSNLYLASGSKDNTVILWDIKNNKKLKVFTGNEDNVRSLAFSKDGRYLASGNDDKIIRVWDISNLTNEIKEFALKYDKEVGLAVLTNQDMDKELKAIESKFSPKGEFETTDAYNKRIEDANAEKKSIEDRYSQQLNEARNQKESEIKGFTSDVQNETERKINESVRDTVLKIDKIGTYNADIETFSLTINFMTESIKIPSSDAVEFKQNYKKAVVRAKKKLNSSLSGWEYYDIYIFNPNNNTEYKFR
jgi:WD40 repeat protein